MFYASVVQKLKLNERQSQVHWRKYARLTPLCHFVTSPPQGGRSPTFARLAVRRALPRPLSRSSRIVDWIAGDAAGPRPISPLKGTLSAYEVPEAAPGFLFSPRGEVPSVGEAMRGLPGPAFALRAPSSGPAGHLLPAGEKREPRLVRRSESIGDCPAFMGVRSDPRSGAIDPADRLQRGAPTGQWGMPPINAVLWRCGQPRTDLPP